MLLAAFLGTVLNYFTVCSDYVQVRFAAAQIGHSGNLTALTNLAASGFQAEKRKRKAEACIGFSLVRQPSIKRNTTNL